MRRATDIPMAKPVSTLPVTIPKAVPRIDPTKKSGMVAPPNVCIPKDMRVRDAPTLRPTAASPTIKPVIVPEMRGSVQARPGARLRTIPI
jgi:hypothetical protein